MSTLSYSTLREAVAGGHVAARSRVTLLPAGGPGDKVAPATYSPPAGATLKYARESRRVDGDVRESVLLGSVADQANRHELALLEGLETGELSFPNPFVDFTGEEGLEDIGRLSALEAPHRVADAIFRDSLLDGTLFRLSDLGRAITDARPDSAAALFAACPSALVFGMWDSTGPKGGLGSKFQRSLVSEIVGYDAEVGVKVGSRIDPVAIERDSVVIYEHRDPDQEWTIDPAEAVQEKGKPKEFDRRGKQGKKGRPSMINHGNVTPSIDDTAGGVTISEAVQTTVLSFAGLRKLRFPTSPEGNPIESSVRRDAEVAARAALAALGLAAIIYQHEQDYDLRSRCLLVPTAPPRIELLARDGSDPQPIDLDRESAAELLAEAADEAGRHGLGWPTEQIRLVPAPKLCELIRRSRAVLSAEAPEDATE